MLQSVFCVNMLFSGQSENEKVRKRERKKKRGGGTKESKEGLEYDFMLF